MKSRDGKIGKSLKAQYADLRKLGDQLAAKDLTRVTDKTRKAVSAKRIAGLKDAVASARGGGQGKVAPTGRMVTRPTSESSKVDLKMPKMNPTQRANSFVTGKSNAFNKGAGTGTWNVSAKNKKK